MTSTPPSSRLAGALASLRSPKGIEAAPASLATSASRVMGDRGPPLTDEQGAVLRSGARKIKVQAFAGTGKTTLLRAFARQSHQAKGLYLAFNQSIARQAQSVFPDNVRSQTHNATALRALGARDAAWRSLRAGKLDQIAARHLADLPGRGGLSLEVALATLMNFIQSADPELDARHAPGSGAKLLGLAEGGMDTERYAVFARSCWDRMADPTSEIPMPHDGYLKLWSIAPAQLHCDFALIDESQDSNPAFLAGMAQQKCRQIYVGDEHQGIYGFRGAVNALSALRDCESHSLTLTHRFGPTLCALANAIIEHKGGNVFLRSSPQAASTQIVLGRAPLGRPPLYLARTNAGLFEQALALAEHGKSFSLVGGEARFNFPDLADLLALARGEPAGRYAAYASMEELEEDAASQGQNDLCLRAKLARTHGSKLPTMLEAINRKILAGPLAGEAAAAPRLSTVHQAKGLESDWVELLNDFIFAPGAATASSLENPAPRGREHIEECNVLYVALTRARAGLAIQSPTVCDWIKQLGAPEPAATREADANLFGG